MEIITFSIMENGLGYYQDWSGVSFFLGLAWAVTLYLLCWRIKQLKELREKFKQKGYMVNLAKDKIKIIKRRKKQDGKI